MQVFLQLNGPLGSNLGPTFNLTTNVGVVIPATATSAQLLAGILVDVDNAATTITVTSVGVCTNSIIIPITNATTTTTAAPTTSTTTTALATTTTTFAVTTTTTAAVTTTTTSGGGTTTTTTASGTTTTTTSGGTTTSTTTIGTTTTTTACVDSCLRIVNPNNTLVAYTLNSCSGIPIPVLIDGLQTEYRCGTSIVDPGGTLVVTNLGNCSVCAQFTTTTSTTSTTTLSPSNCLCWTVTNISTATIDYSYIPCGSVDPITVNLAGPGTEYVCSSVSPLTADPFSIIISGGITPCTENNNCVP